MTLTSPSNIAPTPKMGWGGLAAVLSAVLLSWLDSRGVHLTQSQGALVAACVYFCVGYMIPDKYQALLQYLCRVGEIVASQDPRLSSNSVSQELMQSPEAAAGLIISIDAISDLIHGSPPPRTPNSPPRTPRRQNF